MWLEQSHQTCHGMKGAEKSFITNKWFLYVGVKSERSLVSLFATIAYILISILEKIQWFEFYFIHYNLSVL